MTTETSAGRTAEQFIERLQEHRSEDELAKIQRYFKTGEGEYGEGDVFIGVRMGQVFALAKEFIEMRPNELAKLLDSDIHEVRAGALSIMDKQARRKKTPEDRRNALFDLYVSKLPRINNWDLVDLAAPYVVGGYLFDKPRDLLYDLAKSSNIWERRTAIVSTAYFLRHGEVEDTFGIAEILLDDSHDLIHKATGWMLRVAGEIDRERLERLLDRHAAVMPRTLLRASLEKFDKERRAHYMGLRKAQANETSNQKSGISK